MAYGVPAIVTDSGGSPELVQNGKSGIVIPVRNAKAIADSIEKLYRDTEFKKSLGMNARKRIDAHFDNDETVKQTINVYRDLLSV
jgi:glycosyltransferase involved in cell wall biosynthesis